MARTSTTITILIADPEHMVRAGLRCLLEREENFEVVAEVDDGLEAVLRIGTLRPHVALVAVALPGLNGLELTRRIRESLPATAVVVVSRYADAERVTTALRYGAAGFVAKQASEAELYTAVRSAVAGGRYLSAPIARVTPESAEQVTSIDLYETLTAREREVLQLTAEGYTRASIARRLDISRRTAEAHRANALHKLRLHDRVELVRYALARGILLPPGGPRSVHGRQT